jgi:hypothetical protein
MKRSKQQKFVSGIMASLAFLVFAGAGFVGTARGATWNRIEPLKSRRADVVQIMGQPVSETPDGILRFKVSGGSVQVNFVDERFVTAKKLKPELVGTVLQIILQHEHSSDTPEAMKLLKNRQFVNETVHGVSIFRNPKEGIVYSFIDGTLKTTRYTFADGQLLHARR